MLPEDVALPAPPVRPEVAGARVVAVVVTAVTGVALASGALPTSSRAFLSGGVATVVALVGTLAAGIAAARNRDGTRTRWALLAAGLAAWAVGHGYRLASQAGDAPVRLGTWADVAAVLALPLLAAGLLTYLEVPEGRIARLRLAAESVMVLISLFVVSWAVVLGDAWATEGGDLTARAAQLAYPLLGVGVATLLVMVSAHARLGRDHGVLWVTTGLGAVVAGDTAFSVLVGRGSYHVGSLADLAWIGGMLLVVIGALEAWDDDGGEEEAAPSSAFVGLADVRGLDDAPAPAPPAPRRRELATVARWREFGPYVVLSVSSLVALVHLRQETQDGVAWWGVTGQMVVVVLCVLLAMVESARLTDVLEEQVEARTAELATSERFFRSLVRNASELVTVIDARRKVLHQTPEARQVYGWDRDAATEGEDLLSRFEPTDAAAVLGAIGKARKSPGTPHAADVSLTHADGSQRRVELTITSLLDDPTVQGMIVNSRDVTERRVLEDQLTHQAFHDPLTDLPNRTLFRDRLGHAIVRARRFGEPVAILFIDLDGFKGVNDGLGHSVGDALLRAFAGRIADVLRASDTFARLGGDEFAVLIEEEGAGALAVETAQRILAAVARPFELHDRRISVGASIGIATGVTSGGPEELLRDADVALYRAKAAGKGRFELFVPSMQRAALERLDLLASLEAALERSEFFLMYQPLFDLNTRVPRKVEALIRWRHPERGLVPPTEFISTAEESGLIIPIGLWVMQEACRQAAAWRREFGDDGPTVAVNVSGSQLAEKGFVQQVADVLRVSGLPAERLVIELTESLLIDSGGALDRVKELKALGVRLAIDDFGTGYSSLSYLQDLPIDILKIDRSFVAAMATGVEKRQLLRSIVDIGRTLRLETVAEGIEQVNELEALRRMGCDLGQGFFLSPPGSAETVSALVRKSQERRAYARANDLPLTARPAAARRPTPAAPPVPVPADPGRSSAEAQVVRALPRPAAAPPARSAAAAPVRPSAPSAAAPVPSAPLATRPVEPAVTAPTPAAAPAGPPLAAGDRVPERRVPSLTLTAAGPVLDPKLLALLERTPRQQPAYALPPPPAPLPPPTPGVEPEPEVDPALDGSFLVAPVATRPPAPLDLGGPASPASPVDGLDAYQPPAWLTAPVSAPVDIAEPAGTPLADVAVPAPSLFGDPLSAPR